MVHLRINAREPNPNPHLLRALAAQVKPIMKAHGFAVNSLEEVRSISSEMTMSSG
jgi:hypothetical protein